MIFEKIQLRDVMKGIDTDATLTVYCRSESSQISPFQRAGILICPGGGYHFTSAREAEPVALKFVGKGFNAFVLDYSTRDSSTETYPTQLLEASASVAYIRQNCEKYNVRKDAIAVCGFSAGGHLAASLGTLWNESIVTDTLGISYGENRPDAMILCYPVISGGSFAHRDSFDNLLGKNPDEALLSKVSLENSVGKHTPPAFIWHTFTDETVPIENTFLFASAMRRANIPFELHIFPDGPHGLSLATRETDSANPEIDRIKEHVSAWFELCSAWLSRYIIK
ncbi:MAG: alpha/beta hydrolase [Oscillospiraceae bacterium]|nr:alpha/beta hydrolase [Oscillospiraceae bacterium]